MIDFHIHTTFSYDGKESAENYVKLAIGKGEKIIGFSEHFDYDAYLEGAFALTDFNSYYNEILRLRRTYPQITILFGVELGYCKFTVDQFNHLIDKFPFDFIINSVHNVEGDGNFLERYFKGKTKDEAYNHYFNTVLESLNSNYDYDVVGHLGYVSRYWQGEDKRIILEEFSNKIDAILKLIISKDKCLEINSSSYACGDDFLPNYDIIKRYLSLGGKNLSFGSDAHKSEDFNRKASLLRDWLLKNGVKELCYYHKRKRIFYKI